MFILLEDLECVSNLKYKAFQRELYNFESFDASEEFIYIYF
jgi:hypothetical protein